MDRQQLKDEIIFKLTGGILKCELSDSSIDMVINSSMREIQRYIDLTRIITIPYERCIDMSQYKVNSVTRIYRAEGFTADYGDGTTALDPMYVSQWQLLSGAGNLQNFSKYALDYAAWNTLLQMRNTTSTDLLFRFDKYDNKLYINVASNLPRNITIEYVPIYEDISQITSEFWIDIITRLCVAQAKIALGTIRTRYVQSGALWAQDGEAKLAEGKEELTLLREQLVNSTQLIYPVD